MVPSRWLALAGGLAAGLALSLDWTASRLATDIPFGPSALADRVIRATPGDVATFFIETFEKDAQRLLVAGTVLALVALGALLGLHAGRSTRATVLVGAAFGAALAVPSLLSPAPISVPLVALTAAGAGAVFAAALVWMHEMLELAKSPETDTSKRQAFAVAGSAVAGFLLGGTLLGRALGPASGRSSVSLANPGRPTRTPPRPRFPTIPGLSSEVTSVEDHYVVDIDIEDPVVDVGSWALEVEGLVERPLRLGFDELQSRFPVVEEHSVLTCVSNQVGGPLVGNSLWRGVRLREVLNEAGPTPGAVDVVLECTDGYTASVPVERALAPGTLLAVGQNGEPLTVAHGFPCRLRVPSLYGMMNAKWLERIELVDADYQGYWAERGWSDEGVVRTQSRIDTVAPAPRTGERSWVAGVAWAGDRGISGVEVSIDDGRTWEPARLREPLSPLAWTQWAYAFTPGRPGTLAVTCRATDGQGRPQDAATRPPHPSGATGFHRLTVAVS